MVPTKRFDLVTLLERMKALKASCEIFVRVANLEPES